MAETENNENGDLVVIRTIDVPESRALLFFEDLSEIRYYEHASRMKSMVLENGIILRNFSSKMKKDMHEFNVSLLNSILVSANKYAFDYCASIGAFLDLLEKTLSKDGIALENFQQCQNRIYDTQLEYRFWVRLRNFVVHYDLPFCDAKYIKGQGVNLVCTKEHLLGYSNWSGVRKDIKEMNDQIEIWQMIDPMNESIFWLYIHYLFIVSKHINKAAAAIHSLLSEYPVKRPVFLCYDDGLQKVKPPVIKMICINTVNSALSDLRLHPNAVAKSSKD